MTTTPPFTEDQIQAYVDDQLDSDHRAKIDAWLLENPEEARRIAGYIEQNRALHALYDPILEEPVPSDLAAIPDRRERTAASPWRKMAAAIILLALGGASGWFLRDFYAKLGASEASLAQNAISAHSIYVREKRHAVEVEAKQEKHLVAWLSKRLGQPIKTPNLLPIGYRLVGGRLLPDDGKPAAHFMYQDESGARLTVYVRRNIKSRETAFQFVSEKDVSAFYWIDEDFAYALVGTLNRDGLQEAAKIIHRDLVRKR